MKCAHHDKGCAWTGSVGDFELHLEKCNKFQRDVIQELTDKVQKMEFDNNRLALDKVKLDHEMSQMRYCDGLLRKRLESLQGENDNLKLRLSSVEFRNAALEQVVSCNQPQVPNNFDGTYSYRREDVVQLTQLISVHLRNKPQDIDSNRIFNCVRSSYLELQRDYSDNPRDYRSDMKMLLATCEASNWFTHRQRGNFNRWYQEQFNTSWQPVSLSPRGT